ncbi:hypothetical protein K0M31_004738, partial [Melipona bicolor]
PPLISSRVPCSRMNRKGREITPPFAPLSLYLPPGVLHRVPLPYGVDNRVGKQRARTEPSRCGGWREVGETSRQRSSTANGRKWTLVREEHAEREKTGKRKRADRWRHRGELGKTGDTFISEWRKGEKRREGEGGGIVPREIEVTGSLAVVFLDRWQSARGWSDKRENTVPAGRKPMGTESGIHGTRETTLATGHSRCEIKHREERRLNVGCARQCFLFKIDRKVKFKFLLIAIEYLRTRSLSGLIVGIYVWTEIKFLPRRWKRN